MQLTNDIPKQNIFIRFDNNDGNTIIITVIMTINVIVMIIVVIG